MKANDSIDVFTDHFTGQLDTVRSLRLATGSGVTDCPPTMRKLIVCALIDALASIRYPSKRSRKRFVSFVRQYSQWSEGDLVSSAILRRRLERTTTLTAHLDKKLASIDPTAPGPVRLRQLDEPDTTLLRLATPDDEQAAIKQARHFELLYSYRNSLAHKAKQPGYAMEGVNPEGTEPYYHCYLNDPQWQLGYPVKFFERLLEDSLTAFKQWLVDNDVDPYDRVEDSSSWT